MPNTTAPVVDPNAPVTYTGGITNPTNWGVAPTTNSVWGVTMVSSTSVQSPGVSVSEVSQCIDTDALKKEIEDITQRYSDLSDKYNILSDKYTDLMINTLTVYDTVTNGTCDNIHLDPVDVITQFNHYVDAMIDDAVLQEKTEINSWKFETFQPRDVLFFELVPNIDPKVRKEFSHQLQNFLTKNPGVQAIILPNDVSVAHLKESDMNLLGWYKK